MHHKS